MPRSFQQTYLAIMMQTAYQPTLYVINWIVEALEAKEIGIKHYLLERIRYSA